MPATYEPIATTTLGSAASSITFSSIPGTYTDLRIVFVGTSVGAASTIAIVFNGDESSTNYSITRIDGDGTAASSARQSNLAYGRFYDLSNLRPNFYTMDIFSYTASVNKTCLVTNNADANGSGIVRYMVELWRSTATITTIKLDLALASGAGNNFAIGTTATLYGILKA